MSHLSPDVKHHILLEYSPCSPSHSFAALAARHGVSGGARTVQRWHARWKHTPQSLERKQGSGKTRMLSAAQLSRHVRAPLLAANRAHRAVHYTDLLTKARQKTGTDVSLRTLRRYGKKELGAKQKHTHKRTADESQCTHTCCDAAALLLHALALMSHCSVC
jgi:transposase